MKKNILLISISLLISANFLYAQFPGGVSASTTNKIWLDAFQKNAADGQLVGTWNDFSGNANNALASSPKKPIYRINGINNMPAFEFDGIDDYMEIGANSILNSNLSTHFVVYERSTLNSGENTVFNMDFNEGSNLIYTYANATNKSYIKNSLGAARNVYSTAGGANNIIGAYTWNGNTGFYQGFMNGFASNIQNNATNTATGHKRSRVGAFNTNYRFKGKIAEVIYYTAELNSAERKIIENYLSAKYQIGLVQDLYGHESTHRFDVIGIGQEIDGNNLTASGITNIDLSATTMNNGDYVMVGHDNGGFGNNTVDVPSGYSRYNQVWRSTLTNYSGTVDIAFDVSTLGLGNDTSYKLLVDADGVFASGAVEHSGVFAGGIVTFTGVTLTSSSFFTLSNSDFSIVSTGVTNDWHLPTTWSCGCIPSLGSDVNILGPHNVFINGQNAQVNNLTIDGSLSFNANDTLQINTSLINNGTLTAGIGTLNFEGTGVASITGVTQLYSLILNNSLGLTLNNSTSIQGWLNIITGSLTTNNNLRLLSNASGTAAFYRPDAGDIIGDYTVERYLDEGESYYLLAPVVNGGDLEDWNQEFEMQGFTGTEWPGGISSVYYFDQNSIINDYNQGYQIPNSTFDILDPKVGYEIYIGDDSKATGTRTIDMTGTPVLGDVTYNCPHVVKLGNPANDGWSLITNPYPAPVKYGWAQITGSFDKLYIKKKDGSRISVNNQWVLGSGEAFWVHANVGGFTMTFKSWMAGFENDINDNYNFKTSTTSNDPLLEIKLIYTHNLVVEEDFTYVGFSEQSTDIKDAEDAYKLNNIYTNKPNLSTTNNGANMEKNILSNNNSSIIPLNIIIEYPSSVLKNYTLEFNDVNNLLANNKILTLEDRALNVFTKLTNDTSYSFSMMDTVTQARFFLHVTSPLTAVQEDVTCYGANDAKIVVDGYNNDSKDYLWKDAQNNTISFSSNMVGADSIQNLSPGVYTVEVTNNNTLETVINTIVINEPLEVLSNFYTLFSHNEESNIVSTDRMDTITVYANELVSFQNNSESTNVYSWNFGDLTTSSLESPSHIYFNPGLYKVELIAGSSNCSKVSEQYVNVLNATGIAENNHSGNFNVFVSDNNLKLTFDDSFIGNAVINITNNLGQVVYNTNLNIGLNHTENIHLENASGVYFVTINNDEVSKTKKIVISNK